MKTNTVKLIRYIAEEHRNNQLFPLHIFLSYENVQEEKLIFLFYSAMYRVNLQSSGKQQVVFGMCSLGHLCLS